MENNDKPEVKEAVAESKGAVADTKDAVANVAQRLANTASASKVEKDKPRQAPSMLVDLTNLSSDQLQVLKAMLNVTPDKITTKKGNILVEIRQIFVGDEKRYIVDFESARSGLTFNAELQKEVETQKIRVKLDGEDKWIDMLYKEFMQADRIAVEVLSQRSEDKIVTEGQVVQRETGKLVEKEVNVRTYWYTVALPNGKRVEIEGKVANA